MLSDADFIRDRAETLHHYIQAQNRLNLLTRESMTQIWLNILRYDAYKMAIVFFRWIKDPNFKERLMKAFHPIDFLYKDHRYRVIFVFLKEAHRRRLLDLEEEEKQWILSYYKMAKHDHLHRSLLPILNPISLEPSHEEDGLPPLFSPEPHSQPPVMGLVVVVVVILALIFLLVKMFY